MCKEVDPDKALYAYQRTLKYDPRNIEALTDIALVYINLKDHKKAVEGSIGFVVHFGMTYFCQNRQTSLIAIVKSAN